MGINRHRVSCFALLFAATFSLTSCVIIKVKLQQDRIKPGMNFAVAMSQTSGWDGIIAFHEPFDGKDFPIYVYRVADNTFMVRIDTDKKTLTIPQLVGAIQKRTTDGKRWRVLIAYGSFVPYDLSIQLDGKGIVKSVGN